jgi:hypothetical protein
MKKYLIILSVIILFTVLISIFLFTGGKENTTKKPLSPTPTLFISTPVEIINIIPLQNSTDVSISSPITVYFSRPLASTEVAKLQIQSVPSFTFDKKLSPDGNRIEVIPNPPLFTGQLYELSIRFQDQPILLSFTTREGASLSIDDQIKAQSVADRNFGQWNEDLYKNYPWYNLLPIRTSSYFVYFNIDSKQFIALLYPSESSSTPIESQVSTLKQEVQKAIRDKDIPDSYEFSWQVVLEP